jgi:hypothetical protein
LWIDFFLIHLQQTGERKDYYMFLFNDLVIWTKQKKKGYVFQKLYYMSSLDIRPGQVGTTLQQAVFFFPRPLTLFLPLITDGHPGIRVRSPKSITVLYEKK